MVQIVKLLIRVLPQQFLTTMVLQALFSAQMVMLGEQLGHALVLVTQDMVMMAVMLQADVLHHQILAIMDLPVLYSALMVAQLSVLPLIVVEIALVRLAGRM